MERTLSAPGKLFVTGEYAVLWGGTARVLAVGPRAQAMVRARTDRRVDLLLEGGRLSGEATPAGVRWHQLPPAPFRFVARAVDLALRAVGREGPGFSISFEPTALVNGLKPGLGSSARATVLAAEAARAALGADFDALKLALAAHASAQDGKGSGGDVAACFAGGLCRYARYDAAPLVDASTQGTLADALHRAPPVELARLANPALPVVAVFTGQSAATPPSIAAAEHRLSAEGAREAFVLRSDALGQTLELALLKGDFAAAREATGELQALLDGLTDERSEAVGRAISLARAAGCAAKQSGAVGGDSVLVIAPSADAVPQLQQTLSARGFRVTGALPAEKAMRGEVQRNARLAGWIDALED